jgi:hypothetical protein
MGIARAISRAASASSAQPGVTRESTIVNERARSYRERMSRASMNVAPDSPRNLSASGFSRKTSYASDAGSTSGAGRPSAPVNVDHARSKASSVAAAADGGEPWTHTGTFVEHPREGDPAFGRSA